MFIESYNLAALYMGLHVSSLPKSFRSELFVPWFVQRDTTRTPLCIICTWEDATHTCKRYTHNLAYRELPRWLEERGRKNPGSFGLSPHACAVSACPFGKLAWTAILRPRHLNLSLSVCSLVRWARTIHIWRHDIWYGFGGSSMLRSSLCRKNPSRRSSGFNLTMSNLVCTR